MKTAKFISYSEMLGLLTVSNKPGFSWESKVSGRGVLVTAIYDFTGRVHLCDRFTVNGVDYEVII